jgi:Bax protein
MMKQSAFLRKINFCVSRVIVAGALFLIAALYVMVAKNYIKAPTFGISTLKAAVPISQPKTFVEVQTTEELSALFNQHDYSLEADKITSNIAVPAIYLATLPNDFAKDLTIAEKKELFMQAILPLILEANNEIAQERALLISLKETIQNQGTLLESQKEWLVNLAEKYRLKNFNYDKLDVLLNRVDEIPVSMALAQAAEETGWGRSYAARIKNATHGVTLPSGVKAYESLAISVKAYMRNLNANPAYKKMRTIRAKLRSQDKDLCGVQMMDGLYYYSELHHTYIKKVKRHIEHHNLERFDDAQLRDISILAS